MLWTPLALSFFLAADAADSNFTDDAVQLEKNAPPVHASCRFSGPDYFQSGSGAGSDPIHGTQTTEPATSTGHPHSWTATPTSREYQNVVATARKLQGIHFK